MSNNLKISKDYKKFKFIAENRPTYPTHIGRLIDSIRKKNLIKDFPIIVNNDMEVLDGQNRFEALRFLKLPIYYRVSENMSVDDISLINTINKMWSLDDFMHQYIAQGKIDYIKLKKFMEWADLQSVNLALKIINNTDNSYLIGKNQDRYVSAGGGNTFSFKSGNYIYPKSDLESKETILRLKELSGFLEKKNPYDRSLVVAYDIISRTENFDYDRLIAKLKSMPIGVYNDSVSLIESFERAYNYNVPFKNKLMLRRS